MLGIFFKASLVLCVYVCVCKTGFFFICYFMRILLVKPAVSCSPNSNITLPFKDYIRAIIPKCGEIAKKGANEVLVAAHKQTALPLNCHDPWKKQGEKERRKDSNPKTSNYLPCLSWIVHKCGLLVLLLLIVNIHNKKSFITWLMLPNCLIKKTFHDSKMENSWIRKPRLHLCAYWCCKWFLKSALTFQAKIAHREFWNAFYIWQNCIRNQNMPI